MASRHLSIVILKQSGTNAIAVIDGVKSRLKDIEKTLPANYNLKVVDDQSEYIEAALAMPFMPASDFGRVFGLAGGFDIPVELAFDHHYRHFDSGLYRGDLWFDVDTGIFAQSHHHAGFNSRSRYRD